MFRSPPDRSFLTSPTVTWGREVMNYLNVLGALTATEIPQSFCYDYQSPSSRSRGTYMLPVLLPNYGKICGHNSAFPQFPQTPYPLLTTLWFNQFLDSHIGFSQFFNRAVSS